MKNILKSKIVKVLFFFFLCTIYCNIGWWYGKATNDAQTKSYYGYGINNFEKAIIGADRFLAKYCKEDLLKQGYSFKYQIVFVLLWPLILLVPLASWVVWFIVWLFKIVFHGGLFRLIGSLF